MIASDSRHVYVVLDVGNDVAYCVRHNPVGTHHRRCCTSTRCPSSCSAGWCRRWPGRSAAERRARSRVLVGADRLTTTKSNRKRCWWPCSTWRTACETSDCTTGWCWSSPPCATQRRRKRRDSSPDILIGHASTMTRASSTLYNIECSPTSAK